MNAGVSITSTQNHRSENLDRPDGPVTDTSSAAAPFVAGPENRLAEIVRHEFASPLERHGRFCPLVICGAAGRGKSHFANRLAAIWHQRHGEGQLHRIAADQLAQLRPAESLLRSLSREESAAAPASMFVIEQLETIARHAAAQHHLRQLIDATRPAGGRVVITSRIPPYAMPGLSAALRSRLAGGLTFTLADPSFRSRLMMIAAFAETRGINIPPAVAESLAGNARQSVTELFRSLERLQLQQEDNNEISAAADAVAFHGEPSAADIRDKIPLHRFAAVVAKYFNVKVADLKGRSRRRGIAHARSIMMYLASRKGGYSLKQIGKYLGGRDHSTVLHGCQKTDRLAATDRATRQILAEIHHQLEGLVECG